jgi:hypothetical protein
MGCHGRNRMVIGFTTTYAISVYYHWCCEFDSWSGWGVQHYVIKFVSDLRQVSGFLWFPPSIKLTTTWNIIESEAKHLTLLATKINTKRDSVISPKMSENKMAVNNCTRGNSNVDLTIAIVSQMLMFHW